jgi:large subunit ribosomal protein L32e
MTEKKSSLSRKALRLRERARNKKPKFERAESWKYDRFSLAWRRPRGLDNKIRQKVKGWPPGPSMGYKGPKIARYLHPSGYKEVLVYNVEDLANIDATTQAARIAHTVGKRKRADIVAKAEELNIKILNIPISEEETEESEEEETEGEEETKEAEETETEEEPKEKPKKEKKPAKETEKKEEKAVKSKAKPKKGDKKQ